MAELVTHDGVPADAGVVDRWERLVAADPLGTFFHAPRYLRLWLDTLGGRVAPQVHEVVEDGATIGIVPVGLHREGAPTGPEEVVRFLGGESVTDYIGPVALPEHRAAVADAYVGKLAADRDWDEFVAGGLVVGSGWDEHWEAAADRHGLRSLGTVEEDVCPRIDLTDGYAAYLDTLPSKQRHELRRKARKLARDAGGFELVEVAPGDHRAALERFFTMNEELVDDKGRFFAEDEMRAWFVALSDELAEDRILRVHELQVGGMPGASCVSIVHGGEWGLYNSAYDAALAMLAPGMVIVSELIRVAAEEGCDSFDMLRGDESYKYRFGPHERALVQSQFRRP